MSVFEEDKRVGKLFFGRGSTQPTYWNYIVYQEQILK